MPTATITAPVDGASASVGQTLDVVAEVNDDTLFIGTDIILQINGAEIQRVHFQDAARRFDGGFDVQRTQQRFSVPIAKDLLGSVLNLRIQVVDHHGAVGFSKVVKIPVNEDQPPGVALSNPVSGSRFVAGLPIELRADATDDVHVARVDFYVNDALVGSDSREPFSLAYDTAPNIPREQVLRIHAVAFDSTGQQTSSPDVEVTLGQDEEPPVVNIASPAVTLTQGGSELAEVIENSDVVFKAAGYDNVGVEQLELRGVRKNGTRFELDRKSVV